LRRGCRGPCDEAQLSCTVVPDLMRCPFGNPVDPPATRPRRARRLRSRFRRTLKANRLLALHRPSSKHEKQQNCFFGPLAKPFSGIDSSMRFLLAAPIARCRTTLGRPPVQSEAATRAFRGTASRRVDRSWPGHRDLNQLTPSEGVPADTTNPGCLIFA
jgi:hypothetical protein